MKFFYSIGIRFVSFIIKLIAPFNAKLRLGVEGRKETYELLQQKISKENNTFWFHCASLGEYEQGLPVFKSLRAIYPDYKVVLSFFSPSGYEIRKNSEIADVVIYMPFDTTTNAQRFLDMVNPDLTIFVKYEIWPNFLIELKKRNHKVLLISALFRKRQAFFMWYGGLMRKSLQAFEHIFTQNKVSKGLLNTINYKAVSVSGDTRFDRVSNQLDTDNTLEFVEQFKNSKTTIIFGSSWPDDDALFVPFINNYKESNVNFIIAPHKISKTYSNSLKHQIKKPTVLFSEMKGKQLNNFEVFVLDTVGYLSKAFSYADIAYIGGAAGTTGLHNILEPAVFGIPIIIGKNYAKFPEAIELVAQKGVTSVTNSKELGQILNELVQQIDLRTEQGRINQRFIESHKGATHIIVNHITKIL